MVKPTGWRFDSTRHSMAARGIKTSYMARRPKSHRDLPEGHPAFAVGPSNQPPASSKGMNIAIRRAEQKKMGDSFVDKAMMLPVTPSPRTNNVAGKDVGAAESVSMIDKNSMDSLARQIAVDRMMRSDSSLKDKLSILDTRIESASTKKQANELMKEKKELTNPNDKDMMNASKLFDVRGRKAATPVSPVDEEELLFKNVNPDQREKLKEIVEERKASQVGKELEERRRMLRKEAGMSDENSNGEEQ